MNNSIFGLVVTFGALAIAYCIYFDRKRISDPNYKRKVYEKRKKNKEEALKKENLNKQNFNDPVTIQNYFYSEIELGDEFMQLGEIDKGIEHLTNALLVCTQPERLITALQQMLPAEIFQLFLLRIPENAKNFPKEKFLFKNGNEILNANKMIVDDDLE